MFGLHGIVAAEDDRKDSDDADVAAAAIDDDDEDNDAEVIKTQSRNANLYFGKVIVKKYTIYC